MSCSPCSLLVSSKYIVASQINACILVSQHIGISELYKILCWIFWLGIQGCKHLFRMQPYIFKVQGGSKGSKHFYWLKTLVSRPYDVILANWLLRISENVINQLVNKSIFIFKMAATYSQFFRPVKLLWSFLYFYIS